MTQRSRRASKRRMVQFQKLYPQYRIDITAVETENQVELALTELGMGKGYDIYMLYDTRWPQLWCSLKT